MSVKSPPSRRGCVWGNAHARELLEIVLHEDMIVADIGLDSATHKERRVAIKKMRVSEAAQAEEKARKAGQWKESERTCPAKVKRGRRHRRAQRGGSHGHCGTH